MLLKPSADSNPGFAALLAILGLICLSISSQMVRAESDHPGAKLVDKNGCKNCHLIGGSGSIVGPPLDGISSHRNREYIERLLSAKRSVVSSYPVPSQLMSHVHLPRKDALSVTDYLLTLPDLKYKVNGHEASSPADAPAGSHYKPDPPSASSKRGLLLFKTKSCIACHAIGPTGGNLGPNLAGVGSRRSRTFIADRISKGAVLLPAPHQVSGRQVMPPSKLNSREISDLTSWLLTLPSK